MSQKQMMYCVCAYYFLNGKQQTYLGRTGEKLPENVDCDEAFQKYVQEKASEWKTYTVGAPHLFALIDKPVSVKAHCKQDEENEDEQISVDIVVNLL